MVVDARLAVTQVEVNAVSSFGSVKQDMNYQMHSSWYYFRLLQSNHFACSNMYICGYTARGVIRSHCGAEPHFSGISQAASTCHCSLDGRTHILLSKKGRKINAALRPSCTIWADESPCHKDEAIIAKGLALPLYMRDIQAQTLAM